MYREPIVFDAARLTSLPRLFVDCTSPPWPTVAAARRRVREQPGWTVVEIATGHWVMVTEPAALVKHLLDWAGRQGGLK
jgi:hypothetical protein